MKAVVLCVFGVLALQSINAQVIRSGAVVATAPIIQSNTIGTTLADTLSLLTVSSLLSEKLPFDYPCGCGPYMPGPSYPAPCGPYYPSYPYEIIAPAPCAPYEVIVPSPCAPYDNCGCGCGNYGYPYNTYIF